MSQPRGFTPPPHVDKTVFGFLYQDGEEGISFPLIVGDNTLGASSKNDIVVEQSTVSWNHALFICRNDKVLVQDSASTNGTFVNDRRIHRPSALAHGDRIRFGDVLFLVWLQESLRSQ